MESEHFLVAETHKVNTLHRLMEQRLAHNCSRTSLKLFLIRSWKCHWGTVVIQAFAKSKKKCVPNAWLFWPSSLPIPRIPGHLQAAGDRATAAAWEPFSRGHCRDYGGRVRCHVPPGVTAAAEEQCSLAELVAEPGSCAGQRPAHPVTTERNHNARGEQFCEGEGLFG